MSVALKDCGSAAHRNFGCRMLAVMEAVCDLKLMV